jgi:hypothetical protein
MTNPSAATPGPDHLASGETVSSSSKLVTLGAAKSIAGGVVATALGFLAPLGVAISDGQVTGQEWVAIATATILGAAAGFGITYATPTKVTLN